MKSIVVGAMLLRTLNAQALDAPAVALAAPAAVLTPGINAPSEAELLGPGAGLAPSLGAGFVLPTGTADVILSQPTPAAPFGAGTTPGTGISFGPDGWRFNKANVAAVPAFGAFAVADTAQDPALDPNAVAINAVSSDVSSLVSSSATSSDVSSATSSDVSSATSSDVSSATSSDVSSATSSDVSSATSSDVSSATSSDVSSATSSDVSSATSSDVSSATSSDVSSTTPVSSDSAIAAPIDASTSSDISSATSSDVVSATSSDVSSATSSDVSSATSVSSDSAIAAPIDASTSSDVSSATSSDVSSTEAPIVTPSETPVSSSEVPVSSDSAIGAPIDASTSSDVSSTPIITPTDSIPISSETPTSVASSSVDVSSSTPVIGPSGIAAPIGSNPYYGPYDPYSIYDPNSPYYDPYAQPPGWEGDDNGDYDGENKPGYDDGEEECPSWCIPEYDSYPTPTPEYDYSPYDTATTTPYYVDYTPEAKPYQEYETTPEYAPYPTPTPAYGAQPKYYPEPEDNSYYPQLKKVRSILRAVRRQFTWPSAYPSPPAYSDDDSGYDGEDGSIPDWLYELSGAPAKPTYSSKPKCPKSCYKPKTTDDSYGTKPTGNGYATKPEKPTYTKTRKPGYKTTGTGYYPEPTTNGSYYEPEPTTEGYYPEPTTDAYYPEPETSTDGYYPDETTEAPYPGYTSSVYYAAGNSSAAYWPTGATSYEGDYTSIPSEPTWAYEPTTLVTQYQSEAYPEQTGGADPGSPAGDYTGDTLDTICPSTCNPFNPAENFCDITTGCATTGGSKYYCACRAGFRADGFNAKDFSKQFKVAGQPYVYLAVSTSCNTPCDDQSCSEVLERDQCK